MDLHEKVTMAPMDPVDDLSDAEANYNESSDEDFNPTAVAQADASDSSDQEDAPARPTRGRGKRKAPVDEELDSGDEVTIEAARKRKAKKQKSAKVDDDDDVLLSDDGGDGGLIKTRAQRKLE